MDFEQKISAIHSELQKTLPGKVQQYRMAPEFRGQNLNESLNPKKAAVMICLLPGKDDLNIVFFKRSDYDGPHGGQISFPGGVFELKDADLTETALRETFEEIGLKCAKSNILGALTPLQIPVSNMFVQPFVAFHPFEPEFTIEKREVDYLIISTISELLHPSCIKKEVWNLHGKSIEVPYYSVQGNKIWGATAMMLSEFLEIILRSGLYPQSVYSGNDRIDT